MNLGGGGGGSYVLFSTTREYFLEIKVKKKICILNIQYSIDRDKKKIGDIIEIYVLFFVLNKS